jgi:cytochrome c-type biogenesis protein CcmE
MGIRGRQVGIAITVILAAVVYVMIVGMRDTMVYYYTVSEIADRQQELTGEPIRVSGQVMRGSIDSDESGLLHRFIIEEGGKQIPVVYRNVVPDTFQDEAEAVVEGQLDADGTFQATFLMAKCPSRGPG